MGFKHCYIEKHPLRDAWCVHNKTFPMIPPFIGTKSECWRAIEYAEKHSEELYNKMKGE